MGVSTVSMFTALKGPNMLGNAERGGIWLTSGLLFVSMVLLCVQASYQKLEV